MRQPRARLLPSDTIVVLPNRQTMPKALLAVFARLWLTLDKIVITTSSDVQQSVQGQSF